LQPQKQGLANVRKNLLKDPGFEENYSPGIPSACYARPGGDSGATYFPDTREHSEGNHSLRLITPEQGKGVTIRFFPISFKAGSSYTISLFAKSDPEQRFNRLLADSEQQQNRVEMPQYIDILLGNLVHSRFVPDSEWRQFVTFVTIPKDTLASFKANLILRMPGQGVAWIDQIKVVEDE
jgi:hypothetical protein